MALDQGAKEQFTIILPTLNEAVNIGLMIETLNKLYPSSNIMVVDDSSTDGTADDARKYSDYAGRIKVIVRDPSDRGLTASVMDGIRRTKTKYFIVLDADFQHPPEDIQKMMDQLIAGKQLAIGVKRDKGKPLFSQEDSVRRCSCNSKGLSRIEGTAKAKRYHERVLRRGYCPFPRCRSKIWEQIRKTGFQDTLRPSQVLT